MRRIAMAGFCLALSASPALAQARDTIQKLNAEWMTAFNKGDAAHLADMYAPDAYVMPAGAEMAKGHKAIETVWSNLTKQLTDAKLTTVDVQSLGPGAAREIGTFSFKTKAQPPESVAGKYLVVWRKMGGQWQLAADIWNMNK
ncbi:MAG: nuclear transport factor 2 family protein [Alphaproteobacteria bacterium]|nr:nuclear transport factor 2 family protein [Alphaproteobacteria bacterium]MBV9587255.1 nuclear transport factor 2 family protein [Alphaproteobacteria bacterium]MBV9967296.1 nuclear transport factor 2 family protein [Alphaproteobacteria bacterium]